MANGQYIGVNGVARKVTTPYIGVEGVARKVTVGYVGVDGVARLFFAPEGGSVVLEVEKITSDTYANETTYTAEEFILLSIHPKTGGTVNVTYGGLTKTITDTSGAARPVQTVFFGTFNGISDTVATPESGMLTIEGECDAFGSGFYSVTSKSNKYCSCIRNIVDFGNITRIPGNAFNGCTKITELILPDNVNEIVSGAFNNSSLTRLSIPASVKNIGDNGAKTAVLNDLTFVDCHALTEIIVDPGNTNYMAENGVLFNKDKTTLISHPSASGSVTIPHGVKQIGISAYQGVTGMNNVSLPDGLLYIGTSAFYKCSGLKSITIPSSVLEIYSGAFSECSGLTSFSVLAETPPKMPTGNILSTGATFSITVPKGCGAAYKAAEGWSNYADRIVEAT